jgi:hypothetical protein
MKDYAIFSRSPKSATLDDDDVTSACGSMADEFHSICRRRQPPQQQGIQRFD